MRRDKILVCFVFIAIIGLYIINFVLPGRLDNKANNDLSKLKIEGEYKANIVLKGLTNPSSFAIDKNGDIYVAENVNGNGRIIKYEKDGNYSEVVKNLIAPINDIIFHRDYLYISQKGAISRLEEGGLKDIINGLPSQGDYSNNGIAFGYDGMIYICQGAATNSGVVGIDNYEKGWLKNNPYFHDYPPMDVVLGGMNFKSKNPLVADKNSKALTGGFLPFNSNSLRSEAIKGRVPGNACISRICLDGSTCDTFAWGIRNPVGIVITPDTSVYATVQGMENRGSRPIAGGKDYLYEIKKGSWLGWPDYEGGEPVVLNKFRSKENGNKANQFLIDLHPTINPPKPLISFNESGRIGIMDLCSSSSFGIKGQLIIPFKKGVNEAAKIVAYDIKNNKAVDFVTNKEDSEFLKEPVQCVFSKDGKLYVLEASKSVIVEITRDRGTTSKFLPNSLPTEYFLGIVVIAFIIYLVFTVRHNK